MARDARKPLKLLMEIRRDLVGTDRICVKWEEESEFEDEERVEGLLERAFEGIRSSHTVEKSAKTPKMRLIRRAALAQQWSEGQGARKTSRMRWTHAPGDSSG
jgi:chorismate mutase